MLLVNPFYIYCPLLNTKVTYASNKFIITIIVIVITVLWNTVLQCEFTFQPYHIHINRSFLCFTRYWNRKLMLVSVRKCYFQVRKSEGVQNGAVLTAPISNIERWFNPSTQRVYICVCVEIERFSSLPYRPQSEYCVTESTAPNTIQIVQKIYFSTHLHTHTHTICYPFDIEDSM